MGHDDPRHPHHHHHAAHEHDDLIGAAGERRPGHGHAHGAGAREHGHAHGHDEAAGHAPHVHAHPEGHGSSGPAAAPAPSPVKELAHGAGVGKLVHFDCFAGLAGDMIVAALLDLGVPRAPIDHALAALPLAGYRVGATSRTVNAIVATRFVVDVDDGQPYRTWREVRAMLEAAPLDGGVKKRALDAFRALAVAEARVHRTEPEDVHFHEVGAVDAIVDIVSASAALEWLGARVSCAPLPMGGGFTRSEHGIIPLPAPAVVELLAGIPTVSAGIDGELVTPTGAALVRANATEFARWPSMRPIATGFGAGTRSLADRPNVLRVVLGDPATQDARPDGDGGGFVVLEANVDDATGELVAQATEALLREGALDAWTSPIGMKKGRPGLMLSALARAGEAERLARVLMAESTTIGVRLRPSGRIERPRRTVSVETPFGRVDVKVSDGDGLPETAKPEDAVVRAVASAKGVSPRAVHAAAVGAYWAASNAAR